MTTSKIIKGVVGGGRYTVTAPIIKEDYGLYLQIEGIELPSTYEVDFSNDEHSGTSVTMIGNSDGVLIPSQFISSGKDIFAFLYHVGEDYGRTIFKFRIPNKLRPDRTDEEPTPEEQSVIDQTIAALNTAVESAQEAQEAIEDMSVSAQTLAEGSSATVTKSEQGGVVHLDFGIPKGQTGSKGDKGDKGDKGEQGDDYVLTEQDKQDIAELVDAGGMVVTVIGSGQMKAIDKTMTEIETALADGTNVVVKDGTQIYPYVGKTELDGSELQAFGTSVVYNGICALDGYLIGTNGANDFAIQISQRTTIPTVNVDDVQINGTSIVTDGVANVPIASDNSVGVLKVGSGLSVQNGTLKTFPSDVSLNRFGRDTNRPITPFTQHSSVFYGLAKASGDTTQSQSSNAVGTYTEDAKKAIRDMIGARSKEWGLIAEETVTTDDTSDVAFTFADGYSAFRIYITSLSLNSNRNIKFTFNEISRNVYINNAQTSSNLECAIDIEEVIGFARNLTYMLLTTSGNAKTVDNRKTRALDTEYYFGEASITSITLTAFNKLWQSGDKISLYGLK